MNEVYLSQISRQNASDYWLIIIYKAQRAYGD